MPDGRVHFAISCGVLGAAIIPAALYIAPESLTNSGALLLGGLIATVITPDIDQQTTTFEERRIYNIHPILGTSYKWFWLPYAKRIPHRSISHWIVIGTLTRVLYLYVWYLVLAILFGWSLLPLSGEFSLTVFLGWTVVDTFHILADSLFRSYYRVWYYRFHPGELPSKSSSNHY